MNSQTYSSEGNRDQPTGNRSGENSILHGFQTVRDRYETIRFMNTYQGMPISYNGNILDIHIDKCSFCVPQPQIISMLSDQITYIKSRHLRSTVKAKVDQVDLEAELVELTDFEYVKNNIGYRSYVRVNVAAPIECIISQATDTIKPFKANILEISLAGMMVHVLDLNFDSQSTKNGLDVIIRYLLPVPSSVSATSFINQKGIIRNITPVNNNLEYRMGIHVFPKAETERLLTRYIARRQKDLLMELKSLCTH